ncbi:MAG: hypothetical protein IPJ18_20180 [Betaproteobacteria bacterium]|nr:hypothetical protein [Betaproteobacteria bacterium]
MKIQKTYDDQANAIVEMLTTRTGATGPTTDIQEIENSNQPMNVKAVSNKLRVDLKTLLTARDLQQEIVAKNYKGKDKISPIKLESMRFYRRTVLLVLSATRLAKLSIFLSVKDSPSSCHQISNMIRKIIQGMSHLYGGSRAQKKIKGAKDKTETKKSV